MTSAQQTLTAMIPVAYFAGSIPFGLIVGLARGVDVRRAGSGNIGATNVGRLLGGKFFALVFLLDVLKGLLPMLAAWFLLPESTDHVTFALWLLVGLAAILGHMFSVFLRLKGGKGVATSAGVILGLWPYYTLPGLLALAVWGATFARTRIVSLASIAAACAFPLAYVAIAVARRWDILGRQAPLLAFALLMAGLIVFRHRSNLARLRAGTEHRFGRKAASNGDAASHNGDQGPRGRGGPNGETRITND